MQQPRLQILFDELSSALVLYARQWCDAPDDAVQEAFIDLANCEPEPLSPKAWLYTTTRRKAQNIARAENRRRRHHQLASEQQSTNGDLSNNWFLSSNSTNLLLPEDVMHGLQALPDDERELLVARVWGELNFEQLAELMNCSISSAHRRYRTALQRLKGILNHGVETLMESSSEDSKLQPPLNCSDGDVEIGHPQTPTLKVSDREKSHEIARSAKTLKRKAGESI